MRLILVIVLLLMFSSCYTARKASQQVWKAQALHPQVVSRICNDVYPLRTDSSYTGEVLQPGDTLLFADTLVIIDTINNIQYKTIRHTRHISDTIIRYRYVQVQNKAVQEQLSKQLSVKSEQLSAKQQLMKVWRAVAIVCASILLICIAIRIWFK